MAAYRHEQPQMSASLGTRFEIKPFKVCIDSYVYSEKDFVLVSFSWSLGLKGTLHVCLLVHATDAHCYSANKT